MQAAHVVTVNVRCDRDEVVPELALDDVTERRQTHRGVDDEVGRATLDHPYVAPQQRVHVRLGHERYAVAQLRANEPRIGHWEIDHGRNGIVTAMSRERSGSACRTSDREPVPRIGRPRGQWRTRRDVRAPRDEIVAVATQLFADQGFDQTTMSEIARAAGLQQSSLYYWFKRKELILQAVFAVNRTPLEFIERVGAGSGSPALKLYRLIRFDTIQLCESPCDVLEVGRLAARQPELFADYWRDRQRLHDWVVSLVRAGVDEGEFVAVDPDLDRARPAVARRGDPALDSPRRAASARRLVALPLPAVHARSKPATSRRRPRCVRCCVQVRHARGAAGEGGGLRRRRRASERGRIDIDTASKRTAMPPAERAKCGGQSL